MSDYLLDHAKQNVWCTPDQDRQFIFKPQRISRPSGVSNRVTVLYDSISLPTVNNRYHVYQIGQVPPELLNVVGDANTWRPISRVCREQNAVIDLYANNGLQFPRFASWILLTLDRNLIVAVQDFPTLSISLQTDPLYIRFYSNAYFGSPNDINDGHSDGIYVSGKVITNSQDIINIQNAYAAYSVMLGHAYGFINGYYTDLISVATIAVGDIVEFVHDSTIYTTFDYEVSDLDTFTSTLDSKQKFLLHSADFTSTTIEFEDDIDFFLYKRLSGTNAAKGLYFHKNVKDAVRSITHVDYSIPSAYVQAYVDNGNVFTQLSDITLRMHIRKSGYSRALANEAHRIKELYKLAPADIRNTLVGIGSAFSYWSASVLEHSAYPLLMRSYEQFITLPMVIEAYGYNAIAQAVANTPSVLVNDGSGVYSVKLPIAVQNNSTVYEYDINGILLGFHVHNAGESHYAVNSSCRYIEALTGKGGLDSGSYYDVPTLTLLPSTEYRFYKSTRTIAGNPEQWVEATLGTDYIIVGALATWIISSSVWFTLIRQDRIWIAYDYLTDSEDPVYRFSINANGVFGSDIDSRPLQVPTGELDLWFNGHALVPDIDYYVNFPEICIITKKYVVGDINAQQKITVRARGFANMQTTTYPETIESGFVRYGEVSRNGLYNLRDDRVLRIVANGRTLLRSSLQFGENGTYANNSSLNGTPYQIRDLRCALGGFLPANVSGHELRQHAVGIDAAVSGYMTLKLPEPPVTGSSIGSDLYPLYSPFCARIAMDIYLGVITQAFASTDPNDPQIRAAMANYEHLLPYDPCLRESTDINLTAIHPHPYAFTLPLHFAGFKLLQKVIRIYLRDRIVINGFFTVS